jgi:hypothetical protein
MFDNKPTMDEQKLPERITVNPTSFGGKPIIRGRRLAVDELRPHRQRGSAAADRGGMSAVRVRAARDLYAARVT